MSLLVDLKYASFLAGRLQKFTVKKQSPYLANFRCDICGDSRSNQNAKKAFLYQDSGRIKFKCHRCGENHTLGFYLKMNHPDLASEHYFEEFEERKQNYKETIKDDPILSYAKPKFETSGILKGVPRISQLKADHKARGYVVSRKIPTKAHANLYFVPNFKAWINKLKPGTYEKVPKLDPRLIIPLKTRKGEIYGVQGRALTEKQPDRYITQKFDEDHPKIFGLENINPNNFIYVLEGPIDSLFVENAIAMAGSDVSVEKVIECTGTTKDRLVYVYDNEPRNAHIHKRMQDKINKGLKVVIWPSFIKEKDINNMILHTKFQAPDIQLILEQNTYSGLSAELEMATWVRT